MENVKSVANVNNSDKEVKYIVGHEEIKLSVNIVNNFLVSGKNKLSVAEASMFIQLCKHRKLNPFTKECYPIKYGNDPAQFIVGKDAFMRKAEENPRYEGHRAGVIVLRNNELVEVEGAFKLKDDTLLGGWAEVYVKGKLHPVVVKVSMQEYSTGKSTWNQKPLTMIRKVAIVQAFREAFPSEFGALYTSEEMGIDDTKIVHQNIKQEAENTIDEQAFKREIDFEDDSIETIESIEVEIVEEVAKEDELGF